MTMRNRENEVLYLKDTPFGYTIKVISGKWKMVIIYLLAENDAVRFNQLQRMIGKITYKTLSYQLKELEDDGIVYRKVYDEVPPKVEYYLTERGESLIPIMEELCCWGVDHQDQTE